MMTELFSQLPLPSVAAEPIFYPCGDGAEMLLYRNTDAAAAEACLAALTADGFAVVEQSTTENSTFATLRSAGL